MQHGGAGGHAHRETTSSAPPIATVRMRAPNCIGIFRRGVAGNLWVTNSPSAQAQNMRRNRHAGERETDIFETAAAQMRAPAHHCDRRQCAQPGHDSDNKCQEINRHPGPLSAGCRCQPPFRERESVGGKIVAGRFQMRRDCCACALEQRSQSLRIFYWYDRVVAAVDDQDRRAF